jgi:aminopeptidase N
MRLRCRWSFGLAAVGFCALSVGWLQGQRLPGGVRPEHYALTTAPDLAAGTFSGVETIDVVLDAPAKSVTLNAVEIDFGAVKARAGGLGGIVEPGAVTLDAAKQQATLTFARALPAGHARLEIAYTGTINDKLHGFYLSKTRLRSYGVTQFEATDARRAFPSFDEPALKATFDISLVVAAGDMAISNGDAVSDTPGPAGRHTVQFRTTPKMSTYLVAWLVGDFACSSGKADGVPIRVCATPEKLELTRYALDAAKYMLHYYDTYFGIKYPMAKLDLVALPDFEAGAMENFGCITFRETDLLVDAKDGSVPALKEVAQTVAHEMAHQWFGDMVTMQWWDNLWLNEGFATWMETKAAGTWHPEWGYAEDAADERDDTLATDSEATTRAIRAQAETPDQINELFDGIAYGKAGAVIGMVEAWVGDAVFRQGVHEYLEAHLYGNATAEDFWNAQTRVSGLPVDAVMRSFVEQPGVPVVRFGSVSGASVAVTEARFLPSARQADTAKWTVPICMAAEARPECRLLTPRTTALPLGRAAGAPVFYANAGARGYYRTAYTTEELAPIVAAVETRLTAPERIGLLGDRWAMMQAGQGSVGEFLDLVLAVKRDGNVAVLDNALNKLEVVSTRIATDADRARLNAVVRREFAPVYAAMGEPAKQESYDRTQMRGTLFETLGDAQDPVTLLEAGRITRELLSGHADVDGAIVDAAVTLTAATGDAAMYGQLQRVAERTDDPDLKSDTLRTLTRFRDPTLVERTLRYAVSDEMRNQDGWTLIAMLLVQRETQDQAWTFVQTHWTEIHAKATPTSGARIVAATGAFCSQTRHDEVAAFFAGHPVEASERTLKKALDGIDDCVRVRAAQAPKLQEWLDRHGA